MRSLGALDRGQVVPGGELRAAVVQVAEAVDNENEYERVALEHDALRDLLRQLGGQA